MKQPKKVVRSGTAMKVKPGEIEIIEDQKELMRLYVLKVKEELQEVVNSDFKDPRKFADLLAAVYAMAELGFRYSPTFLHDEMFRKNQESGSFGRWTLNNLNPKNPSNAIYFVDQDDEAREKLHRKIIKELLRMVHRDGPANYVEEIAARLNVSLQKADAVLLNIITRSNYEEE